jgi:hypothetical protein
MMNCVGTRRVLEQKVYPPKSHFKITLAIGSVELTERNPPQAPLFQRQGIRRVSRTGFSRILVDKAC